jgi:hypothetical protein
MLESTTEGRKFNEVLHDLCFDFNSTPNKSAARYSHAQEDIVFTRRDQYIQENCFASPIKLLGATEKTMNPRARGRLIRSNGALLGKGWLLTHGLEHLAKAHASPSLGASHSKFLMRILRGTSCNRCIYRSDPNYLLRVSFYLNHL